MRGKLLKQPALLLDGEIVLTANVVGTRREPPTCVAYHPIEFQSGIEELVEHSLPVVG
jgi:hypothetical protein